MSLTKKISRRALVLTPTNAEVSTNQTIAPYYDFRIDGVLSIPIGDTYDATRFVEAEQLLSIAAVSVVTGGTSTYRVVVTSYDSNGLNAIEHLNQTFVPSVDNGIITLPFTDANVPQNRTLKMTLTEELVADPAEDFCLTLTSGKFADLDQILDGHIIQDGEDNFLPQRTNLKFAGINVDDDLANDRTIVQVHPIGTYLHSDLTEPQFQSQMGDGWVLADGQSAVGSAYETLTGKTNVPDTRGRFFRGLDTTGSVDPDGAGRSVGDTQEDAFQGHEHNTPFDDVNTSAGGTAGRVDSGGPTPTTGIVSDGVNGAPRIDEETRPKNVSVNIFIRIN